MTQADCDIVVTLCLRMIKHMNNKLRWLSEPLPGVRTSAASGEKFTPHVEVHTELLCVAGAKSFGCISGDWLSEPLPGARTSAASGANLTPHVKVHTELLVLLGSPGLGS
jgi:hypothetical protein